MSSAWVTDKVRKEKRAAPAEHTLNTYIQTKRAELLAEREGAPQLTREADELRARAAALTERWQFRMRAELLKRADGVAARAEALQGGDALRDFEKRSQKYVAAGLGYVDCEASTKRAMHAPGSARRQIDEFVDQVPGGRGRVLVNEFMAEMRDAAPRIAIESNNVCPKCSVDMVIQSSKAIIACETCGYMASYMDATSSSMSYTDDVEFACFSYRRINHFNEWLQQIQAKESADIPNDVLQKVMEELHMRRVTATADITPKLVRDILRTLKLRKTYDHVAQITSKITGKRALTIPAEAEEMCRLMFIAVQPIFDKVCPKDRKNFLSYAYILYKFFQLLGYDELLDSFSLLKGRDKLQRQDDIFKLICEDLDWEFIASI